MTGRIAVTLGAVGWFCAASVALADGPRLKEGPLPKAPVATPASKTPVPRFVFSAEARYRYEARDNFDFSNGAYDGLDMGLVRTRAGLLWNVTPRASLFIQAQDARSNRGRLRNQPSYQDALDLKQAFADLRLGKALGASWALKAGRQTLAYGEERMLGAVEWSNVGQTFDAVRVTCDSGRWKEDLFVSRRVTTDAFRLNGHNAWEDLWGWVGSWDQPALKGKVEPYVFFKHFHRGKSLTDETTLGIRWSGQPASGVDALLEGAFQVGSSNGLEIGAHAVLGSVGYTLKAPGSPRLGVEWDYASGDPNPADGRRETFDNLYPTNHKFYGYLDRASLQNLDNKAIFLSVKPHSRIEALVAMHFLGLATPKDALYDSGRAVLRAPNPNATSKGVGREVDFLVRFTAAKRLKQTLGYSRLDPYGFVSQTGNADRARYFYAETTFAY